jgi:hypothetical protein
MKIAGVGARSAEVSRAFNLPSGGGSHAAGTRSLGRETGSVLETESV